MRVMHICKVTGIAGAERHLLTLLPGIAARGFDVSMLVLEEPDGSAADFCHAMLDAGVPVDVMQIHRDIDLTLLPRLTNLLREKDVNLAHTHLVHADLYGLSAAYRAEIPYAVSSRHNNNPFRENIVIKLANQFAMRQANRVIAISEALADFVHEVEGIPRNLIETIHYGMDSYPLPANARQVARERMEIEPDAPLIGFFGRLVRQKGVDVLLRAFTQVVNRIQAVRLVIVGDGDLREHLECLAHELSISDAVSFTGWRTDARDLMPACDVITMPSRWEGFGMVALEAMNSRCPLVASEVSALPEIINDGQTGLLVEPNNPDALASALTTLLNEPARAASMGEQGYQRLVNDFTVENMVKATCELYETVMAVPDQEQQ